jgi:hypothetical protein
MQVATALALESKILERPGILMTALFARRHGQTTAIELLVKVCTTILAACVYVVVSYSYLRDAL